MWCELPWLTSSFHSDCACLQLKSFPSRCCVIKAVWNARSHKEFWLSHLSAAIIYDSWYKVQSLGIYFAKWIFADQRFLRHCCRGWHPASWAPNAEAPREPHPRLMPMTVVLQGCQLLRAPWVSCCSLPPGHFLPWTHLGVTLKGTLKIQGLTVIARKHLLKYAFALHILCRWLISSRLIISFSLFFFPSHVWSRHSLYGH